MGPLFILGFPRSGTTAMAKAVTRTQKFGAYAQEGHFLHLFAQGLDRIAQGKASHNSIMEDEAKRRMVLQEFRALANRVYSRKGDPCDTRWIDKTPDLAQVRAIPVLNRLWPGARYIFLYRDPFSAVRSNLALWPNVVEGREGDVAKRWAQCHRVFRTHRALLSGRCAEIYQPDMLSGPGKVAEALGEALDLGPGQIKAVAQELGRDQAVNRPRGDAGAKYDAVALSAAALEAVEAEVRDEADRWPRLKGTRMEIGQ
ncbi:MAG: sulfotransferase [Pseudomonadota bacterium]